MTAHELLTLARAKIASPDAWTQGAYARDKHEDQVWSRSVDACQFCMAGALLAVVPTYIALGPAKKEYSRAFRALANAIPRRLDMDEDEDIRTTVITFGDSATHAEVLAAYDRAIQATANRKE